MLTTIPAYRILVVVVLAIFCEGVALAAPQAQMTPWSLAFGPQLIGTSSARTATISNTGDEDLTVIAGVQACCVPVRDYAAFALGGTCPTARIRPGESCTLSVVFTPHFPDGTFAALGVDTQPATSLHVTFANVTGAGITTAPFAHAQGAPSYVTPDATSFGTQSIGLASATRTQAVANYGVEDLIVKGWRVTEGNAGDFRVDGCSAGTTLKTLETCTVSVTFTPAASGERTATLVLDSNAAGGNATFALRGEGTAGYSPGRPAVDATALDFGTVVNDGTYGDGLSVDNAGGSSFELTAVRIVGPNAADFSATACATFMAAGAHCRLNVYFTPTGPGKRAAQLQIDTTAGSVSVDLAGKAAAAYYRVPVRQYYNEKLDHYFLALTGPESIELDTGTKSGWKPYRQRELFNAVVPGYMPAGDFLAVCRFYIPPGFGDSHFFSASKTECEETARRFPQLVLESPSVFYVLGMPDPSDPALRDNGGCPWGTRPVYRLWNNRPDSNHFYTDDRSERAAFIAKGWIAEGVGTDGAAMCS